MADNMPDISMSNMMIFAITAREMYVSLVAAGFTPDEALTFVAKFAVATNTGGDEASDES